eukprot:15188841-Alexandrium_andersonii.AAC.1
MALPTLLLEVHALVAPCPCGRCEVRRGWRQVQAPAALGGHTGPVPRRRAHTAKTFPPVRVS